MKRKIDRLVEYVAPVWAAKRKAAREILNIQATNYRGASTSRIFKNWSVSTVSPDAAVDGELETLRNASRDLNRNEAVAAGMTDTFTYNTVHTGLMPQSKIDHERIGITEEQATDFQTDAEEIYRRWQETASACGRMTFSEIQLLAARQIVESGEFFAIRRAIDQSWRPYFLSLEPVEADRIEFPAKNTEKNIRYGIEFGERGEPLRYSARWRHPGDSFYHGPGNPNDYKWVKARDDRGALLVYHLFAMNRPAQTRGVPWFAPVIERFRNMADYIDATIVSARVAACFSVFITSEGPYAAATARADETTSTGQRLEYIEPGMIQYLSGQNTVTFGKPEQPQTTFEMFTERLLRMIGTSLNLPYEMVIKDFSKTNYSSAKAALEQAYRFFRYWQAFITIKLCQPVWRQLLWEAWNRGELVARDFQRHFRDYTNTVWVPTGWVSLDALKEAQADEINLRNNSTTLAKIAARSGEDWEDVLTQRAREKNKAENLGLSADDDPGQPGFKNTDDDEGE
jgi:lambda family phage portal protein